MKDHGAKPVLLLDVDGVLNVIRDEGTKKRLIRLKNGMLFYPIPVTKDFLRWVWKEFNVFWLTAWFSAANEIAAWAKLPERPSLYSPRDGSKLDAVIRGFRDHKGPVVWVEDGIGEDGERWVDKRPNFLYIHTDPWTGVTREHIDQIAEFCGIKWRPKEKK